MKIAHSISEFTKAAWNDFVPENHPFLKYEFYQALEESKCIGAESGWLPFYLKSDDAILPIYLKSHSYGEFIFDWSWAQAYERVGLQYYPKLTAALPHTPVSAPKVISRSNPSIIPFLEAIENLSKSYQCSSTHLLFTSKQEASELEASNYARRLSFQYHWQNNNYQSFADFLNDLRKDKRKNIKKERAAVKDIEIQCKTANDITRDDALFMSKLYFQTIEKKWSQAYLNQEFFLRWFGLLKEQMLFVVALKSKTPIAAAIHLKSDTRLFGRYWGCLEEVPYLHFELCYYQAMEYAIEHKLQVVEAGAQGEQKLLRGFRPTIITSHHKIEHSGFKNAIHQFLLEEAKQINHALPQLDALLPFKRDQL